MSSSLSILYSFRRCPYAMRARFAVIYSGIPYDIREVDLKNKPQEMFDISPKGTVPVLLLPDGNVIEESLEIMEYALSQNDPDGWADMTNEQRIKNDEFIAMNDGKFKEFLDKYKYFDRHSEHTQEYYRGQCEELYLSLLEEALNRHKYLIADEIKIADIALMPFVRQFANVDREWFDASGYKNVQKWLQGFLDSKLFAEVMVKPN